MDKQTDGEVSFRCISGFNAGFRVGGITFYVEKAGFIETFYFFFLGGGGDFEKPGWQCLPEAFWFFEKIEGAPPEAIWVPISSFKEVLRPCNEFRTSINVVDFWEKSETEQLNFAVKQVLRNHLEQLTPKIMIQIQLTEFFQWHS